MKKIMSFIFVAFLATSGLSAQTPTASATPTSCAKIRADIKQIEDAIKIEQIEAKKDGPQYRKFHNDEINRLNVEKAKLQKKLKDLKC